MSRFFKNQRVFWLFALAVLVFLAGSWLKNIGNQKALKNYAWKNGYVYTPRTAMAKVLADVTSGVLPLEIGQKPVIPFAGYLIRLARFSDTYGMRVYRAQVLKSDDRKKDEGFSVEEMLFTIRGETGAPYFGSLSDTTFWQ